MGGAKRVGLLAAVVLWAGFSLPGLQTPLTGERQASAARAYGAASEERFRGRADGQRRGEAQEIRSQVQQPTAILFVAPQGQIVKQGDLLVELDIAALTDERMRQTLQVRKAEGEVTLAQEAQEREIRAAREQVAIAEKALSLAQGRLRAFTEGEYPQQLALAESAAAIARQKLSIIQDRMTRLRAHLKDGNDSDIEATTLLQETEIDLQEAKLQAMEAEGSLTLLKSFIHDNRVAELELVVAEREFDLTRAKDALSAATMRGNVTRSLAEMGRSMESERLARLDDQIAGSRIYAPRDGTVIYPNEPNGAPLRPGTVIRERQIIIYLRPASQSAP